MNKMFGVPNEGLPVVYRLGGSQIYHITQECTRLRRPSKQGSKVRTPSSFDIEQAQALGWSPCASCSQ